MKWSNLETVEVSIQHWKSALSTFTSLEGRTYTGAYLKCTNKQVWLAWWFFFLVPFSFSSSFLFPHSHREGEAVMSCCTVEGIGLYFFGSLVLCLPVPGHADVSRCCAPGLFPSRCQSWLKCSHVYHLDFNIFKSNGCVISVLVRISAHSKASSGEQDWICDTRTLW